MDPLLARITAVQEVKRQAETMLMSITNVVATGVGFKIAGDQLTTEAVGHRVGRQETAHSPN